MKINSAQILIESKCNLRCSYCYIEKNPSLNDLHDKIVDAFEKDIYINTMIDMQKDGKPNITNLDLWGGEPTLGLSLFGRHLDKFIDNLPSLNSFFMSTNFTTDINILVDFIKLLDRKAKNKTTFILQISLDGPPNINDAGRGEGVTSKIISNLESFFEAFAGEKLKNVTVDITFKSTIGMDTLTSQFKKVKDVLEYYSFFDNLYDDCESNNINKNINVIDGTNPTLAYPGQYSSIDGIELVRVLRLWQTANKGHKLNHYDYLSIVDMYLPVFANGQIPSSPEKFIGFCGVGMNTCAITYDGKKTFCHRCIFDYYENTSKYNADRKGLLDDFTIVDKSKEMQNNFVNIATANIDDKTFERTIDATYKNSSAFVLSNTVSMLSNLANSGQANPLYLTDHKALIKAAYYISAMNMCLYENIITTGSYYMKPLSLMRLFGNGAVELIIEETKNREEMNNDKKQ